MSAFGDMTDQSNENSRGSALWIGLLAAPFLEFLFFIPIAGFTSWLLGQGWGPGSSIQFFRSFYVLPVLLVFLLAVAAVLATRGGRSARADRRFFLGFCVANVVMLAGLLGWYFGVVTSASR